MIFISDGVTPQTSHALETNLKDVRVNCFCAFLLRTQIHLPRHAWERVLRTKMNNDRAHGHCYSFAWI